MIKIRDTQIAIKQYQKSLTLEGISKDNGQPDILKSYLNNIKPYHQEILELLPDTDILTLDKPYKNTLINLQPYLSEIVLPSEKFNTVKQLNSLLDYQFNYSGFTNNYLFDLTLVPYNIINKLAISQRFRLYTKTETELGIITAISNKNFEVKTKDFNLKDQDIIYGKVDNEWQVREYVSIWTNDICFEESSLTSWLQVKLYNTKKLYNCGWSLYYQEDKLKELVEVAKGTDNVQSGYGFLSKDKAIFKKGFYKLRSRIVKYGNYSTNYKEINWELTDYNTYLKNE